MKVLRWLPAAVWAYLLVGRSGWWRADQFMPPVGRGAAPPGRRAGDTAPQSTPHQPDGGLAEGHPAPAGPWPDVAIIVPARNEAAVLGSSLPSLLAQDYPGHAWVVLVDDESSDATADVARRLAAQGGGRGLGLSIVRGSPRPEGWAGKPWAMEQGLRHALSSPRPPEWALFTDADIRHPAGSLRELVGSARSHDLSAVSLMARLSTSTGWEKLLVPAFVYFFAQLYPFPRVNDPLRRTAAAAGGCFLVRTEALLAAGGLVQIAGETIDDVALAKRLKATGSEIWLGLAAGAGSPDDALGVESTRAYPGLGYLWDMVARNAYTQLRNNPLVLAATVAALAAVYVAPPAMVAMGLRRRHLPTVSAGMGAWTAMAATYRPIVRYYGVRRGAEWALPLTAGLYGWMTLASALRHYRGATTWKDRRQG